MAVCARADAMGKSATENLQREICKGKSVLRTTDGKRSKVGSDCSKTNF